MNFGIEGKTAIVCGASGGLGRACAIALAQEGVNVVLAARTLDKLQTVAQDIHSNSRDVTVMTVACDISTVEGREILLSASSSPDILVNNGGGPPFGDYKDLTLQAWQDALNANMLAPIELIRQTIGPMIERRFGRIINVTSSAVKAPIDILSLSNGARMGLTGYVAGVARKVAAHNVTINNLLPSLISTERTAAMTSARAKKAGMDYDRFEADQISQIPAGRFGTPEEFGAVCAFVCSKHTGYMTGQNFLVDGGLYPGTF